MANDDSFFGWTVVAGKPPKGVSAALANLVDRPGVVCLYKGDPEDPTTPRVLMSGTKGGDGDDARDPLDPDILLDLAKREAIMEEFRLSGFDLSGNRDVVIGRIINHLRAHKEHEKADFMATSRAMQLARGTVRAMSGRVD